MKWLLKISDWAVGKYWEWRINREWRKFERILKSAARKRFAQGQGPAELKDHPMCKPPLFPPEVPASIQRPVNPVK